MPSGSSSLNALVTVIVSLLVLSLIESIGQHSLTSGTPKQQPQFLSASTPSCRSPTAAMARTTMRAILMHEIGSPSVLKLQTRPRPVAEAGHVLIRIKAFGLNRSEMFTRQGHSPGVTFPRILGIEATGEVESAPGAEFQPGDVVVTAMGGMGRLFDGGYAEYTVVPASQVLKIDPAIAFGSGKPVDWSVLGALPELMQTAWGSLHHSLELTHSDRLLIRGGTSGVGLAAAALAKDQGVFVAATTRNASRVAALKATGVDEVIVDGGSIADEIKERFAPGFNKVLELVGVTTLDDSLKSVVPSGIVCLAGITGGKWTYDHFTPRASIPTAVKLTTYGSSSDALLATPIDQIAAKIVSGQMKLPIKTFKMEEIVEAHRLMEEEGALAKLVILID